MAKEGRGGRGRDKDISIESQSRGGLEMGERSGVEGWLQSNRTRNQSREAGSTWLPDGGEDRQEDSGGGARAEEMVPG